MHDANIFRQWSDLLRQGPNSHPCTPLHDIARGQILALVPDRVEASCGQAAGPIRHLSGTNEAATTRVPVCSEQDPTTSHLNGVGYSLRTFLRIKLSLRMTKSLHGRLQLTSRLPLMCAIVGSRGTPNLDPTSAIASSSSAHRLPLSSLLRTRTFFFRALEATEPKLR